MVRRRRAAAFTWAVLIGWVALFLVLNTGFSANSQNWRWYALLPVELLGLAAAILLAQAAPALRPALKLLAVILLPLGLFLHVMDMAAKSIYGRSIDLVFDAAQIPHVLDLLAASMGWAIVILAVAGILLAAALLIAATGWVTAQSFSIGARLPTSAGGRAVMAGVAFCLLAGGALDQARQVEPRDAFTSASVWGAARHHARVALLWIDDGALIVETYRAQRGAVRDGQTTLPGLKGADVYLIFIESYGASILRRPEHRARIDALYADYAQSFAADGRGVASTLVRSSTFGGLSWLAHLTTTTGAWIDENLEYRAYLQSDLDMLSTIMRRSGYDTSVFMPGIRRLWPEGALLNFDRTFVAQDFGYSGVEFGYFFIPDQFTLERVPSLLPSAGPRFAQIALVSSHYPFIPIPPFLENRDDVMVPEAWAPAAKAAGSFTRQDWATPLDGYIDGVSYSLRSALDFVDRHTTPDDIVIVMGDHQPWTVISDDLGGHAVPIHLFTGRDEILRCFLQDGYNDGLDPDRDGPLYGMESILQRLVLHFGDAAPAEDCAPPIGTPDAG